MSSSQTLAVRAWSGSLRRPQELLAEDAGEMLDAGVEPGEFRELVQGLIPIIGHQFVQVGLQGHDVHQKAVGIEDLALQQHLHLVMMGVG